MAGGSPGAARSNIRPCGHVWGFKVAAQPPRAIPAAQPAATASVMPGVLLEWPGHVRTGRGWSRGGKDWRKLNCTGGPLILNGRQYANGIGLHAAAEAVFEIKPGDERFVASVGVDDAGREGCAKVLIYGDDKLLLETDPLKCRQAPVTIDVPVPHAMDGRRPAQLRIVVNDAGDGINDDRTDLVNAGFVAPPKK